MTGRVGIDELLSLIPLLFVLALFLGYFAVLLAYGQSLFRFPFDYDQGEGFELYDAIRLARGQSIYLDNAAFPFYSSNYPPVYRLILVPLIWLFGPHLWVGRVVAFAMTLITGVFIYMAARRQMRRADASDRQFSVVRIIGVVVPLIAALAFFAANYVYEIAPLARAHMPMVMFAFAGIYLLDRAFDPPSGERVVDYSPHSRRYVMAGITFLIVAGFTKLQAVDALAAGFLFLLLRKPRWFLIALAASAAVSLLAVVLLNAATGGNFWLNVVLANVNEYDIQRTWFYYGQWFQLQGVLIVCSAAYVVWDAARAIRARSFNEITAWSLYFLSGSAMGMLTGKWGAGPTYLIAAIAASCICTVGLVRRTADLLAEKASARGETNRQNARFAANVMAILCAGVFVWQAALNIHLPTSGRLLGKVADVIGVAGRSSYPPYPYYDSIGYTQLGHLLDPADIQNGWDLVQIARSVNGPVWSEEAMLTLNAGKDVVTNPTQLLNLSKNDMLDTTKMIAMIRQKAFGAAIFRAQFYPQDVMIAFGQNYHWVRAVHMNGFDYQVLYPNGK
ncbi:MAG: hypothetical protein M1434_03475 [Chloroflexi bacterium]|nr:hypothetical protein [Chloroflexota bacterium]MCL5273791.1 hypothetical protein [Chloroflexota bacterium]